MKTSCVQQQRNVNKEDVVDMQWNVLIHKKERDPAIFRDMDET